MPSPTQNIGWTYTIYEPDVARLIALGYSTIRVYSATSEDGTYSLYASLPLVSGTLDYSSNNTAGLQTDWGRHTWYGVTPGESGASEPTPMGAPRSTRKLIRQGVGQLLRMMDGPYALASVTSSTVAVISDLIDPDASAHRYANRFIRVAAGTGIGQTRRVRAANATPVGYVPATGTVSVNRALSPAWIAADSVEIWRAKGDEDVSAMVDAAMNDAAAAICFEDTFFLTIDSGVSEYYLPAGIGELNILSVEYAVDTYPSKPDWRPVGYANWSVSGGSTILTVLRGSLGTEYYSQSDVIRVRYAAFPDNMDSDTDYWSIPLQWAVAETALAFLDTLGTPSGGLEQVIDAERSKASIRRRLDVYRGRYMPAAQMKTVVAR